MPGVTVSGVSGASFALAEHAHCVTGFTLALCQVNGLLKDSEAARPLSSTVLSLHTWLSTEHSLVGRVEMVRCS